MAAQFCRPCSAHRSSILVNIASTGALAPNPGMVHYCAAKAELAAASESLRGELRRSSSQRRYRLPGTHPHGDAAAPRGVSTLLPGDGPAVRGARGAGASGPNREIQRRRARVIYPRVYSLFRYLPWVARVPARSVDSGADTHSQTRGAPTEARQP